ncbi:MAG TPA: hypothetical protein VER39_08925 [Nocardioidaceae bacterium]|nr:hypothetical protein [Nocardioidaceae bacterium]
MTPGRIPRLAAWLVVALCGALIAGTGALQMLGLSEQSARDPSGFSGWGGWVFRLAFLAFAVVGRLIGARAPGNLLAPLFLATGFLGLLGDFCYQYADRGLYGSGAPLPGGATAAVLQNAASAPTIGTLGLALLLFPDGRLPTRRIRWAALVPAVGIVSVMAGYALQPGPIEFFEEADNPWGVAALDTPADVAVVAGWVLMPLGVVLGGIVTVRRFRRSTGLARQQLKWVALAGVAAGLLLLANAATWLVDADGLTDLRNALIAVGMAVFPSAVGVAILRYRLYDVDVVINRTIVYSGLTAALATTYLSVVLVLQVALQPVTDSSDLAVAGSTLLVAALFRPVRARIQAAVDRRFYRSRYDAARIVAAFTADLRDQVDLDTLARQLVEVASSTVHPVHASVWLRDEGDDA